ncbi:hypothetical protein RhiirA1_534133 [Rhizophagus irregularis]|uniref:Uncharacterized protein n=1 Tax=Rhizophagus irregularis TaxID=588596 RepID=A0A2N0RZ13_9GLOM|nr:hypothetical protein RhiirA1_534133 [Rhizophagus irregularis]CAB4488113.1 unnamed protein product [Rhizophagus irregularis]
MENNFDTSVDYIINIQVIKRSDKYFYLNTSELIEKYDAITKEILHETKLHREIDYSNVMINVFGITKIIQTKNIYFVTEDTLRNYLKENFPSLNWLDKYGLALQLSNICTKEK